MTGLKDKSQSGIEQSVANLLARRLPHDADLGADIEAALRVQRARAGGAPKGRSSYASTVGNSNNSFPWARGTASMRIQFLIDSTHFTSQGVVSPIIISQLRYRPYPGAVLAWAGGSWPNVRIDMATSPLDWSVASTTFANILDGRARGVGPDG